MKNLELKSKLNSGELCLGSWITLGDSGIAEIMCNAGFDWLVVDLEHSTISLDMAGELIRTIDLAGVAPLVRLTSNNPDQIKRVMDAGAHGIVVPMVNSPNDVMKAVAATRYAPEGNRGVGLGRAQGYGPNFNEYLKWQKDSSVVIAQIEDKEALDHLEDILAVSGVDGIIIGPYDLSCSMGMPGEFEQPEFKEAMSHILNTTLSLNRPVGLHVVEPDLDQLSDAVAQGYRFIAYSVDVRMLDLTARAGVQKINEIT